MVEESSFRVCSRDHHAVFNLCSLYWRMGFGDPHIVYISNASPGCELPCEVGRSYPDFLDFRDHVKTLESLIAYGITFVSVSGKGAFPDRYEAMQIPANGMEVLGHRPVLGRSFMAADEQVGAAPVTLLAYGMWERRYGMDPSIVGKTIRVSEVPTVVIGVMGPDVNLRPLNIDMWLPLVPAGDWLKRENAGLMMFGLLALCLYLPKAAQS